METQGGGRYQFLSYFTATFGPLLKFKDLKTNIEVELALNKILDPINSELLLIYTLFDNRFHKLALLLKKFNKFCFPDNKKRLNNYSLTVMLIAYL